MKVVILAGGLGTRLSEETDLKPKPMIDIGGKPILWHILKIYSHYGFHDFVICLGYKGYVIKEYFANYSLHMCDVTFDLLANKIEVHQNTAEPWRITLVDTGQETMTGGRLKRIREYVGNETFMMTYGDGVANVNIDDLVKFHKGHGKAATVTAVEPVGRFGMIEIDGKDEVVNFVEKPVGEGAWINGGFFVLEPSVFDYIDGDDSIFERAPLEKLASEGRLMSYKHRGFWQPVDTLRDKRYLEERFQKDDAPWKVW